MVDMVVEQLMPGALLDHSAQQVAQGPLLFGAEYTEDLLVRGNCIVDDGGRDVSSLAR